MHSERLKHVVWRLLDANDRLRGRLLPPRSMRGFAAVGDFTSVGEEFLGHLIELGSLRRDDCVLDVGSGIGRMAVPLARWKKERGTYQGVDVWRDGVAWCQENISANHPNFRFHHLDLFDAKYNPSGASLESWLELPFGAGSIDLAIMISILHLDVERVRLQVLEISRLLAPKGTYLGTWLLQPEAVNSPVPSSGPIVHESEMRSILEEAGLSLQSIHYGSWAGRSPSLSHQDVVIAQKPS